MKFKATKTTTELGGFKVISDKKEVTIKSIAGDWSQTFTDKTLEYAFIISMINDGNGEIVHQIAQMLFATRLVFQDAELYKGIMTEVNKSAERINSKSNVGTQSDDEILAEQKVLHEKTVESINELQDIKNGNKKTD